MQRIVKRRVFHFGSLQFLLGFVFVIACSDSNRSSQSSGGGTIVIALSGDPGTLFPPLAATAPARQIDEQIYDYLLVVGTDLNTFDDGKFQPRLAESWQWSSPDSLSIAFKINPRARWHDGAPADARDVQFSYQTYRNPELASPYAEDLANVDSVTVRDSLTAVFWYHARSAHQLLDASQPMIIPRHIFEKTPVKSLAEFGATTKPIGTGRFRFQSAALGASVEIVADSDNYRGRPGVDRVIWSIGPSATAATRLFGGEVDVYAALRPDHLADLAKHPEIRLTTFPTTEYTFIRFNINRPLFASRVLRRALTMAVDRTSIVQNVFDTLASPAVGPTVRVFPTTEAGLLVQIPFDAIKASTLLDSLGWTVDRRSNVRMKNGRKLEFTLIVPSSSVPRNNMAVLIQEQLRRIGVRMNIEKIEFAAFNVRLASRDFDAAFPNLSLGATPNSVSELWGGESARRKDGSNYGGYENPLFDAEIDSAIASRNLSDSRRHFTKAYQTIIDDAPAIWLSEQKIVMGVHRRIKTTATRADSWWYSLADWTIPAAEQIARDHVPMVR